MALHYLYCADVPLRNCLLTHSLSPNESRWEEKMSLVDWLNKWLNLSVLLSASLQIILHGCSRYYCMSEHMYHRNTMVTTPLYLGEIFQNKIWGGCTRVVISPFWSFKHLLDVDQDA